MSNSLTLIIDLGIRDIQSPQDVVGVLKNALDHFQRGDPNLKQGTIHDGDNKRVAFYSMWDGEISRGQ